MDESHFGPDRDSFPCEISFIPHPVQLHSLLRRPQFSIGYFYVARTAARILAEESIGFEVHPVARGPLAIDISESINGHRVEVPLASSYWLAAICRVFHFRRERGDRFITGFHENFTFITFSSCDARCCVGAVRRCRRVTR